METANREHTTGSARSNPIVWLATMAIAGGLVLFVFVSLYGRGEKIGELTPKTEEEPKTGAVDVEKLKIATPELISKGESLFQVNCASCHGPAGRGDGLRSAELNPKPRNYHTEKFKFGARPGDIFNTIANGSPGTSMPSFALLPVEDRWALVHFVRSQIPNPPQEEGTTQIAGTSPPQGTDTTAQVETTMVKSTTQTTAGPRIPIEFAMQRMAESDSLSWARKK